MRFLSLNILAATTLAFGANAYAGPRTCIVRKAIAWLDPDGTYRVRRAETKPFTIVSTEHEEPYTLEFSEKDGANWDSVEIMTGTLLATPEGDVFQVVAQIKGTDSEIISRLALIGDTEAKFARSITTIDLPDTDRDPSLTVECKLTP